MFDLGIEFGTVVTGKGRIEAHLYVQDGRIAAVCTEQFQARERIDASGLHILPGMIDGHVHFQDPGDSSREDFIAGSSAAAVGGTTMVIEHTHSHPVRTPAFFQEKAEHLRDRSVIDFGLAAHVWPEDTKVQRPTSNVQSPVGALWETGVVFFKVFTCTTHGVPALLPGPLLAFMEQLEALDGLCLVHCEDESITSENEARLRATGRVDPAILLEWRTREAEQVAGTTAALLARWTGARTIIAHASHPAVAEMARRERTLGARLWVETCPQYLYLTEEEVHEHGPFRKFTPPARSAEEGELLWKMVADGLVTHISTDHAPSTRAQKEEGSIWECPFGLPGAQTTLSLLLEGVNAGSLTLERVVQLTAEEPARLYRLWPKKGCLAPGADADLALVDLEAEHPIEDGQMLSKAGWSPYAGRTVHGRPVMTVSRGRVVARNGRIEAKAGTGRLLLGPGAG